jgi:hypothetical protein
MRKQKLGRWYVDMSALALSNNIAMGILWLLDG